MPKKKTKLPIKDRIKYRLYQGANFVNSLYENINKRKAKGISRPKSKSTISDKAYSNMKAGFPKRRGGGKIMYGYKKGGQV